LGDPTGSNATAGLALRVTGTHKPLYHGKVKIPTKEPHLNQEELHDLIRQLQLPKSKAEFLASYLKE
jgi:hypothetical protein